MTRFTQVAQHASRAKKRHRDRHNTRAAGAYQGRTAEPWRGASSLSSRRRQDHASSRLALVVSRGRPVRPPVVDAVLGHGEMVGRRLHAVLIRVLHDGELLLMAQHARLRLVRLGSIRVLHDGELKVGVARSASSYRVLPARAAHLPDPDPTVDRVATVLRVGARLRITTGATAPFAVAMVPMPVDHHSTGT